MDQAVRVSISALVQISDIAARSTAAGAARERDKAFALANALSADVEGLRAASNGQAATTMLGFSTPWPAGPWPAPQTLGDLLAVPDPADAAPHGEPLAGTGPSVRPGSPTLGFETPPLRWGRRRSHRQTEGRHNPIRALSWH